MVAEPRSVDVVPLAADILVVDDTSENLIAIEAALAGLGMRLVSAHSGEEALRHLLERDFALILLDVQMPKMDGLETASVIRGRERNRHVPIIFVTAHDHNDDVVLQAYRMGAVDFLFKPINTDVLRAKASVFVELQRRTAEVARQAALLREQERVASERALAEQRRKLEDAALRERLSEERRHAERLREKHTELELAYSELQRVNAHLEADDHRKDEFIAVLAHELRNPLVPIMTGLDLLDQSGPPTPELAKVQPAMRRQVYHLVRLVDDLLDVSRITSGKIELRREWVKPQEVVDRAVEMSRPGIDSQHHTLTVNVAKDWGELRIHGDPVRLAQVISNLLNNAARYTDQGGRILLTCVREAEGVLFRVVDDGHGMTAALVERVFDMFVQGRPGGGGLGIGLTLVSRMVELHGGYTRAHSAGPGHGSTFEVWIPMSEPRAVTIPSPTADPDWSMMPRLRVGLVEDNEDIREMTRMLVMGWGHEVVGEAGTASEGIEMLCAQRPDVAIVDIGLPDSNGFEVAKAICKSLGEQRPRLIAVSGFSQPQDRKMSAEAGFDEHLTKPVRDNILRRALIPR